MKALFVFGLLVAACFAQDWFYSDRDISLATGVDSDVYSNDRPYSSTVELNGNVCACQLPFSPSLSLSLLCCCIPLDDGFLRFSSLFV